MNLEYKKFYKALDKGEDSPVLPLFLKWDELSAMRNIFCFRCFTGMRFSELQNLKKEDVGDDEIVVRRRNGKFRSLHLMILASVAGQDRKLTA